MSSRRLLAALAALAASVAVSGAPAQAATRAPLGSTEGSFIDGSQVYGVDAVYQHNQTDLEL
jgi:hypothetical protein